MARLLICPDCGTLCVEAGGSMPPHELHMFSWRHDGPLVHRNGRMIAAQPHAQRPETLTGERYVLHVLACAALEKAS